MYWFINTRFGRPFGLKVRGAHGIVERANRLFYIIMGGVGATTSHFAGAHHQASIPKAREFVKISIVYGILLTTGLMLAVLKFTPFLIAIFMKEPDPAVFAMSKEYAIKIALSYYPMIFSSALWHAFIGKGDNKSLAGISVLSLFVVRIGLLSLCLFVFGFGSSSVWNVIALSEWLVVPMLWWRYNQVFPNGNNDSGEAPEVETEPAPEVAPEITPEVVPGAPAIRSPLGVVHAAALRQVRAEERFLEQVSEVFGCYAAAFEYGAQGAGFDRLGAMDRYDTARLLKSVLCLITTWLPL